MCYLHNVYSGLLTLDINTLALIQRKTSSVLNMWSGFAITKKNIIVNDERSNLLQQFFIGYKPTHSAQDYTPAPQYLSHNT